MLLLDYFRGQDSTGLAAISKKGEVEVLKMADDPIMLFQHQDFESTLVGSADAIWIGHNRAATVGEKSRSNAHPFKCGDITGVHNGTLEKECFFDLGARLPAGYGTDSETIFQHIDLYGVADTIPRLDGAYALVWYDSRAKTLNMIKNAKRPLFTCRTTRGTSSFLTWASEYEMIVAARAMANIEDGKLLIDEDGYGFFPLPDDVLHTWTLDQLLIGDLEATLTPMKGAPEKPKVTPGSGFSVPFLNNSTSNNGQKKTLGFNAVEDKYDITETEYTDDDPKYFGMFDEAEWDELTRYGCSCCGSDIEADTPGLVIYSNEGVVICPSCSGEAETIISNGFGLNISEKVIG